MATDIAYPTPYFTKSKRFCCRGLFLYFGWVKKIAILTSLLITLQLAAQNPAEVDSLKQALATQEPDTNRIKTLLQLVIAEQFVWEKSEKHLEEALRLSRKLGDWQKEARTQSILSWCYGKINEPEKSLLHIDSAYAIYQKNNYPIGMAFTLNRKAGFYDTNGAPEKAFQMRKKALEIFENEKYEKGIATSMIAIGNSYNSQGDYKNARKCMLKALDIYTKLGDQKSRGICFSNLGYQARNRGNYKEAQYYFQQSQKIKIETFDIRGEAAGYNRFGSIYEQLGKPDSALINYEKALEMFTEQKDPSKMSLVLTTIGLLKMSLNQNKSAVEMCSKAAELAIEADNMELEMQACLCAATANKNIGNGMLAVQYFLRYDELKDTLQRVDMVKELTRGHVALEYEQKMKNDSLERVSEQERAKQKRKEQEAKIKQQTILITCGGIALFLILGLVVFLQRSIRQKQKAHKKISDQKQQLEFQNQVVETKNKEITDSINYAHRIQSAILPEKSSFQERFSESFVLFKPKDIVSGDFYWLADNPNEHIFTVADCTGHGVPGAFMSMIGTSLLNEIVNKNGVEEPGAILSELRHNIIRSMKQSGAAGEQKDGMDMALCNYDPNTKTLQYAGANNPLWLYKNKTKEIIEVKPDKRPISYFMGKGLPFTNHKIKVETGDTIFIFTDGFADQFGGEKGKKLKYKPFRQLILDNINKPMEEQGTIISQAFEEWKGDLEQVDDVCVIGVRI